MGVNTDGIVCFGVPLIEDEMPWHSEEFDGDYDDWILEYLGFDKKYEDFDDAKEYWKLRDSFSNIKIVVHCSCESEMYIIALKQSVIENARGYCESLPSNLDSLISDELKEELNSFLIKFKQDFPDLLEKEEPGWYLVSLWC